MSDRKNDRPVDSESQADARHRRPSHRATGTERNMAMEDIAYHSWCNDRSLDPGLSEHAAKYEREVGLLYP